MELDLYVTKNAENEMNKTLTDKKVIDIHLRTSQSIQNPSIILNIMNYDEKYNYAYIPFFKRYYFVRDVDYINAKQVKISLDVDVLESFKSSIFLADSIIITKEQPSYYDSNVDSQVKTEKETFNSNVTLDTVNSIIMTTIGG